MLVRGGASFILITAYRAVAVISITITVAARADIISGSCLPLRVRSMNLHPTAGKSELSTNRTFVFELPYFSRHRPRSEISRI